MLKKILLRIILPIFILMNVVAVFHAYKFTHFSSDKSLNTIHSPSQLSTFQKAKALFLGVDMPKPTAYQFPDTIFQEKKLQSNKQLDIWEINVAKPKGTILVFHGFGAEKSSEVPNARYFNQLGYNTILVDFMGAGSSEGTQTTIGYFEAENVKTVFDYAKKYSSDIILYGSSMGAASITRAIAKYDVNPDAVILECPFGTMEQTVKNRFNNVGFPSVPMAYLLLFWGGTINRFWAYNNNPQDYAKSITQPTLLMYGAKDQNVLQKETNTIFQNISSKQKTLKIFPEAGHENYIHHYSEDWKNTVASFLSSIH